MDVPKFKGLNYDEFMTSFTTLVSCQTGVNDLPLDYLMRENATGLYDAVYASREAKLKHCIRLTGDNFRTDSKALYSLYIQHIGTTGTGSSVLNRFKDTQDGYNYHKEFKAHFANETYMDNLSTTANNNMNNAVYNGPRKNFTIETYYTIMTTAFNDLATAGTAHALNEEQKISKFEGGIKEEKAISFIIQAKREWNVLAANLKTFDRFYNLFSAKLSKQLTMSQAHPYNTRSRTTIHAIESNSNQFSRSTGRGGRGRGRGRLGGRGRSPGRGRGYGRNTGRGRSTSQSYHPYQTNNPMIPTYGSFVPEAKIYPAHIFNNLNSYQKREVSQLKTSLGWSNANTPPSGSIIDQATGHAVPMQAVIAAFRSNSTVANANMNIPTYGISLPSPPPIITVPQPPLAQSQAGAQFSRSGSRASTASISVNAVSINGQPYSGQVYDQYGNPLN